MSVGQTVALGEICSIIAGGTPDRSKPEFYNGHLPWVKISDMLRCPIKDTEEHITREALKSSTAKLLPAGTVLISIFATIGRISVLDVEATTNQAIVGVIPKSGVVLDVDYLRHALSASTEVLLSQGRGVAQSNINGSILKALRIPYPELPEQRRIAAILDRADALRRKRQQAFELTDAFLRATFLDLFGDPATNPKRWPLVKVEDVLSKTRAGIRCGPFGSALKREEYTDEGIPVWGIDNVLPNEFREENSLYIDEAKYCELRSYNVQNGDLLISRAGTVGRMCVAQPTVEHSIIGTNLIRVSLDQDRIAPEVFTAFFMWFSDRLGQLRANGKADAYSFMKTGVLKGVSLPLPSSEAQKKYLAVLKAVKRKNEQLMEHQRCLETLTKSLQSKFF